MGRENVEEAVLVMQVLLVTLETLQSEGKLVEFFPLSLLLLSSNQACHDGK